MDYTKIIPKLSLENPIEMAEYYNDCGADEIAYFDSTATKEGREPDIQLIKDITRKINQLNLSNNEALSVKGLYPKWEDKIGSTIEAGFITLYDGNLWRTKQMHTVLKNYPPSMSTTSLYEVIVEEHEL